MGHNVDVTRENLPPAVSGILALRVLRQTPDLSQMLRCIDWFILVFEVGLRFDKGNQLLEQLIPFVESQSKLISIGLKSRACLRSKDPESQDSGDGRW